MSTAAGSPSKAHGWCAGPRWTWVQVLPQTSTVGAFRDRIGAKRGRNIGVVAAARKQIGHVYYALRDHHVRAVHRAAQQSKACAP